MKSPGVALAIAAHPDDIEFLMAGTLLLLKRAGYELHYWNLANGCCGTTVHDRPTIIAQRRAEGQRAAEQLGATYHESICDDLGIFYDAPTLAQVAGKIRHIQPQVILTHAPSDYMEDHMNTSRLAVTAAFSRGMPNFPVEPPAPAVEGPVRVYHAQPYAHHDMLGTRIWPHFFVDVTDVLEQKVALLAAHESQKRWLDESQGLDSYLTTLRELDAEAGTMSGKFVYAEGWRKHHHLGFCTADFDPLRSELASSIAAAPFPSGAAPPPNGSAPLTPDGRS